jgi:superfamily II DNA or RNA helicase
MRRSRWDDIPTFDLRPYPFQEEILDVLAAEREVQDKHRHLVVAATGTGKTMIAAFDYRRWAPAPRPSLLFVAHREEILQAGVWGRTGRSCVTRTSAMCWSVAPAPRAA